MRFERTGFILGNLKKILVMLLNCILVLATIPDPPMLSQTQETQAAPGGSYAGQGAPLSANELQQLVAPIALYPDALVAQVLGAATFPDQIAYAGDWLQQNKNLTGQALMQAVDRQPWDPSVKALTQFPSVLDNMTKNLSWTSSLGEAYHTQPNDVMTSIQTLRAQAKAVGNLKSGSQITVVQESPQTIVIQPTNPQVVYVPQYNPSVAYGTPYTTPGYSTADMAATGLLAFGVGIAVGAAINNNSCCGWGYSYWGCNWHGGTVVYNRNVYYGNNAWHGGVYGSGATAYGPYGAARVGNAYNPSTGTYARGASAATPYGAAGAAQAYNPSTGAYGATRQTSNAYGNYGSSVVSANGNTAYTQHQTTANGSVGTVQTSQGGRGVAGTNANGNFAAGQTANGNRYATANGNQYQNTGSGWQKNENGTWSSVQKPSPNSSNGYGEHQRAGGASAFGGGGGGWQTRAESARGSMSRGGGGGWRRR
ncbi:MAG TPA: DUF3300 domain-containing protein [Edaphobacter sp.]